MTYLLDANVVIALADDQHPHRRRCDAWFQTVDRFAVCPITQGALVRYLVRVGHPAAVALAVLRRNAALSGFEFWRDDVSYVDADLSQVRGHRQVTDAYLVELVRRHPGAKLATLDEAQAGLYPNEVYLIPEG